MTRTPPIQGETWFNTEPLAPEALQGKVILVDFWTYSCVNCLRTMPYLKAWWEKYGGRDDFIMIGVHTPEFTFEKEPENVQKAIDDIGINWPVVLDNKKTIWDAFANRFWPAKYLIDTDGQIIYHHFGEGSYAETEQEIQAALGIKEPLAAEAIGEHEHEKGGVCFVPTAETYCGYARGDIANREGYREDSVFSYERPRTIEDGYIGLEGKFLTTEEYVESREKGATLYLQFHATEVNLVLTPASSEDGTSSAEDSTEIRVFLNDKELPESLWSKDIDEQGVVQVTEPRMYRLLKAGQETEGTLAIQAEKGSFQAHAFTFSGCEHE